MITPTPARPTATMSQRPCCSHKDGHDDLQVVPAPPARTLVNMVARISPAGITTPTSSTCVTQADRPPAGVSRPGALVGAGPRLPDGLCAALHSREPVHWRAPRSWRQSAQRVPGNDVRVFDRIDPALREFR